MPTPKIIRVLKFVFMAVVLDFRTSLKRNILLMEAAETYWTNSASSRTFVNDW